MKKKLLQISVLLLGSMAYAQVGVGTFTPDQSAQLEIKATNKGMLAPRLQLQGTNNSAPIVGTPAQSLFVYNTATVADVTPGFYYWENNKWNKILNPTDISQLETLTTLGLNADGKNLDYVDEHGITTQVDLSAVISNFETLTSLIYDPVANTLIYTDENNQAHQIDIATLVHKNETVTGLVDNADGTFTYTNEAGSPVTYDVNAVVNGKSWLLKGNSGTDPLTDFLGTVDATDLKIKTNSIERIHISSSGKIGIGTSAPTSNFATVGSESKSIVVKTNNYTATENDHTIVYKHSATSTLDLPDATTCSGRLYYIINNGATDLSFSRPIEMAAGVTTTTLGTGSGTNNGVVYGNRILIQSDGSAWVIIQ